MRLLETLATLSVALLATRAAFSGLATCAAALGNAERQFRALTVARNMIEAERALPCSRTDACPSDLICSLERRILMRTATGELLILLRATVAPRSPQQSFSRAFRQSDAVTSRTCGAHALVCAGVAPVRTLGGRPDGNRATTGLFGKTPHREHSTAGTFGRTPVNRRTPIGASYQMPNGARPASAGKRPPGNNDRATSAGVPPLAELTTVVRRTSSCAESEGTS